jgi:DNA-binding NarL/FixJ family response regulator
MIIRTAIFDINENVRNSISLLLNTDPVFEIVGSFSDATNCVQQALQCKPDIVLIDIGMSGLEDINAVSLLTKEMPQIQILIQTSLEDCDRIFDAIKAGASGYILKSHINGYLINALKELRMGGAPMSPSIARKVLKMLERGHQNKGITANNYNLTARERDVLKGIVNGQSHKMIGADLYITYDTVRSHVKRIYEKLNVASAAEAVAKAILQKIV